MEVTFPSNSGPSGIRACFRPLTKYLHSGLKSQHVTSIEWLAKATGADVTGLDIGSKTLDFRPHRGPGGLVERNIHIHAASPAASALLIFQAVFPFLLLAGNESNEPVELTISGGTNVSFSLSYEYLDQVLLPTLEDWFQVRVERRLQNRGWSSGSQSRGSVYFKMQPLPIDSKLGLRPDLSLGGRSEDFDIKSVDVTIIAPADLHTELENALRNDLSRLFDGSSLSFKEPEDSKHESRIYALVVAKSRTLRWGRDVLYSGKRKGKTGADLSREVSRAVTRALRDEVRQGGVVDEFLHDQLVIFQALAKGQTSFPRSTHQTEKEEAGDRSADEMEARSERLHVGKELRKDRVNGPLGEPETDSNHTRTARWVTSEILQPKIKWYDNGRVCEGVGLVSGCGINSA